MPTMAAMADDVEPRPAAEVAERDRRKADREAEREVEHGPHEGMGLRTAAVSDEVIVSVDLRRDGRTDIAPPALRVARKSPKTSPREKGREKGRKGGERGSEYLSGPGTNGPYVARQSRDRRHQRGKLLGRGGRGGPKDISRRADLFGDSS